MASQFFGLTIASSGLTAYQASLNTTANNLANVYTEGYSRQTTNLKAAGALRAYAKYGTMGSGVVAVSVTQTRNQFYDSKYWYNNAFVGYYDTKLNYYSQIEAYFTDDDTTTGFSTLFSKMFSAIDSLTDNAADSTVRQEFIGTAQNLATYFNSVASSLSEIQSTINTEVKTTVEQINSIAEKIAKLNEQINRIEIQGGYANELRDERALLVDQLSEIVSCEVSETEVINTYGENTGSHYYVVTIGGQVLVDTNDYNTLSCVAREVKSNQSDIDGLYDIVWTKTGNTYNAMASSNVGTLQALIEMRDGNNAENLSGTVENTNNAYQIKVVNPSITTIQALNMPEQGTITINGKTYTYNGFSYELDDDGNITSFTFNLDDALTEKELIEMDGKQAAVGNTVKSMGIPYYMAQMNEYLRSFCKMFNDILLTGQDIDGLATDYYSFFTGISDGTGEEYFLQSAEDYYNLTASNICISSVLRDPTKLATTTDITQGVDAYDLTVQLMDLYDGVTVYRGCTAADFLTCIMSDITLTTNEANILYENYSSILTTVDNQRTSVAGVDVDEEGMDMVKFQYAYNLSSKMVSVMAEIYDKLIEETGV